MEGWDTRKVLRMLHFGMVDEVVESRFPWVCTGCGRCAHACPMDLDIPYIMLHMKSLRPRDKVPGICTKAPKTASKPATTWLSPRKITFFSCPTWGKK